MNRAEALGSERVRVPVRAQYVIYKKDDRMDAAFTYNEMTIRSLAKFLVEKLGSDLLIDIEEK
ncbi:MAG: hypothetical protein IJR78_07405 [Clostridia bacterium]|nr:hypothetical protein [Clostridia bacterium]